MYSDFWVGGMTIEEAFKRVAEIERVKEYISRFCESTPPSRESVVAY